MDNKTPETPGGDSSVPNGNNPSPTQPDAGATDPANQAYTQGQNYAQSAYGQTPEQTGGAEAAAPDYSQGSAPAGAPAAGAYTQGAYTQGADGSQAPQGAYTQPGAYGAQGTYPPSAPRKPADPAKKKKIILFSSIAAGLVLLLIIGIVVINSINSSQYGPEATVKKYLTAISQGKASTANKLVEPGVKDDEAALLADDILKESPALMKGAEIDEVRTRGNAAQVEVSYSIDGTAYDGILELSKDGKQGLFFDKWVIDKPLLASVYVYSTDGEMVSVNGQDINFGKNYELAAYPAAYEIGAPEGDFFEAEPQTFVAATGSKADYEAIDLELTPTQALTDAVQEQVNKYLDTCATQTVPNPENCGLRSLYYFDFSGEPTFSYKVDKYPEVTIGENGKSFEATKGQVTGNATGELSYPGGQGTGTYAWDDWGYSGNFVIDGDEVTIEDTYIY